MDETYPFSHPIPVTWTVVSVLRCSWTGDDELEKRVEELRRLQDERQSLICLQQELTGLQVRRPASVLLVTVLLFVTGNHDVPLGVSVIYFL